eukprot:TRINITY_DN4910_c0_g1_i1.p1 TRINITY_DN4910_c0_g1~~TRINITY_DN4910_c0_g1_i1.p1  ORF type:complete len:139 (-),score=33.92 TRINITY_DN4910_c0_g1_i1:244-660(-)
MITPNFPDNDKRGFGFIKPNFHEEEKRGFSMITPNFPDNDKRGFGFIKPSVHQQDDKRRFEFSVDDAGSRDKRGFSFINPIDEDKKNLVSNLRLALGGHHHHTQFNHLGGESDGGEQLFLAKRSSEKVDPWPQQQQSN